MGIYINGIFLRGSGKVLGRSDRTSKNTVWVSSGSSIIKQKEQCEKRQGSEKIQIIFREKSVTLLNLNAGFVEGNTEMNLER